MGLLTNIISGVKKSMVIQNSEIDQIPKETQQEVQQETPKKIMKKKDTDVKILHSEISEIKSLEDLIKRYFEKGFSLVNISNSGMTLIVVLKK